MLGSLQIWLKMISAKYINEATQVSHRLHAVICLAAISYTAHVISVTASIRLDSAKLHLQSLAPVHIWLFQSCSFKPDRPAGHAVIMKSEACPRVHVLIEDENAGTCRPGEHAAGC